MLKPFMIFLMNMLLAGSIISEHASLKSPSSWLPGAKALEAQRFQSPKGFEETIKELKKHFGSKHLQPSTETINLPHVRSCTLHLTDGALGITSINIYLNNKTGITEFFVLGPSP